jgi:hypothetical protein
MINTSRKRKGKREETRRGSLKLEREKRKNDR